MQAARHQRNKRQRGRLFRVSRAVIVTILSIFLLLASAIALVTFEVPARLVDRSDARALSALSFGGNAYDSDGYRTDGKYLYFVADYLNEWDVSMDDESVLSLYVELADEQIDTSGVRYDVTYDSVRMDQPADDYHDEVTETLGAASGEFTQRDRQYDTTIWSVEDGAIVGRKKQPVHIVKEQYRRGSVMVERCSYYELRTTTRTYKVSAPQFFDITTVADNARAKNVVDSFLDEGWDCMLDISCIGDDSNLIGCCNALSKTIRFRDSRVFATDTLVVYHELGHFLDYQAARQGIGLGVWSASTHPDWRALYDEYAARGADGVFSDYDLQNPIEMFAEAYAQYVVRPHRLMTDYPDVFEYVRSIDDRFADSRGTERNADPEPEPILTMGNDDDTSSIIALLVAKTQEGLSDTLGDPQSIASVLQQMRLHELSVAEED